MFQRGPSNTPWKTLHQEGRSLQLYCYCPRNLEQKAFWKVGTGRENILWAQKDLMYLPFLLASLKYTFIVQAILSEQHVPLSLYLTYMTPVILHRKNCDRSCPKQLSSENADSVERYWLSAPNKLNCTFNLSQL